MRLKFLLAGLALVVILGIALVCPAVVYFHYSQPLQTVTGEAITGATYFVYTANTTDTVAIYSDLAGTRNYQGSGESTGSTGMIDFYAPAGRYDIAYEHTGWNISGTVENVVLGSGADSLDVAVGEADTMKVGEKLIVGSDGARATIRMGPDGDDSMAAEFIIPDANTCFFKRDEGDTHRVTGADRWTYGLGNASLMLQEETSFNFARAAAGVDSYIDRPFISLQGTGSSAYDGKPTTDIYSTLQFENTLGDSTYWMFPIDGDTTLVKGKSGKSAGSPYDAFRFVSDLPDSNGTDAERIFMLLKWWPIGNTRRLLNSSSSFLACRDRAGYHYFLARDQLKLYSLSDNEKSIIIYGKNHADTVNAYTRIENIGNYTQIRANHGDIRITDREEEDDATLTVNKLVANEIEIPATGTIDGGVRHYTHWIEATTGIAEGSFLWADPVGDDDSYQANTPTSASPSTGKCYGVPLMRAGSITGLSVQTQLQLGNNYDRGPADSFGVYVFVNGDSVFRLPVKLDTTGAHGRFPTATKTQAAGVDTFSAGDLMYVRFWTNSTGDTAMVLDRAFIAVEVQYND